MFFFSDMDALDGVWYSAVSEQSQNTVLLASTQAVYKAPHSTVQGHSQSLTHTRVAVAVAVGSLRA